MEVTDRLYNLSTQITEILVGLFIDYGKRGKKVTPDIILEGMTLSSLAKEESPEKLRCFSETIADCLTKRHSDCDSEGRHRLPDQSKDICGHCYRHLSFPPREMHDSVLGAIMLHEERAHAY
ncbi:MAG: hypothetical protein KKF68_01810 [Nanoarchaeota archaeon]|nr:hypothetical protein [Nanoarchaeota archaeon]